MHDTDRSSSSDKKKQSTQFQFGGNPRDAQLFTKPDALDRAMGPKVAVSADRMRGQR